MSERSSYYNFSALLISLESIYPHNIYSMDGSVTEPNSINPEPATDRKMITVVYVISWVFLLAPLILLGKAYYPYFFKGGKKDFVDGCKNPLHLVQSNLAKGSVDLNRIKQLEADTCENVIWRNEVASNINWAWNLFFIVLPISSTIALAVESDPKLKSVLVAITSASTILVSRTEVDQWYKFQNNLAGEGYILVSRLNYGVNTNTEFEKMVKDYQSLISRSSVGQPSSKSAPDSNFSSISSPSSP